MSGPVGSDGGRFARGHRTALLLLALVLALLVGGVVVVRQRNGPPATSVFVIAMENQNGSSILGNSDASYINSVLLPQASYAARYFNPPGIHPSLPDSL